MTAASGPQQPDEVQCAYEFAPGVRCQVQAGHDEPYYPYLDRGQWGEYSPVLNAGSPHLVKAPSPPLPPREQWTGNERKDTVPNPYSALFPAAPSVQPDETSGRERVVQWFMKTGDGRTLAEETTDHLIYLLSSPVRSLNSVDKSSRLPSAQPDECICTNFCPESDNPCPWCRALDVYDPCPVIGFGCGSGGNVKPGDPGHDCCTDEQLLAAAGNGTTPAQPVRDTGEGRR